MKHKTYSLNFKGYWSSDNLRYLPDDSGIYCVYRSILNQNRDVHTIVELIDIGESDKVRTRIQNHELSDEWIKHLKIGENLCFSYAEILPKSDRKRAEAALINRHKPPVNKEYVNNFPFCSTTILTGGQSALLDMYFTVEGNRKQSI